ncbi:YkgJ family cysteine cluster protein [Candidatus Bathyarchaeota archaeon]|nr:YkgJ family cysteine cluster protein [Candidatus Bathyarchaeota archaeon]
MQPPDVDLIEQKRIEDRGFNDFIEEPDETGMQWIKRKEDDSCWFLTKDNKCQIYEVRPAVCRLEPFTIVDYDYENNTVELEPNFPFCEACGGFSEDGTVERAELVKAVQVLIGKILDLTAYDMELPVTDKRVQAEARSRLLRRTAEAADLNL